jgi:hypothetical protein
MTIIPLFGFAQMEGYSFDLFKGTPVEKVAIAAKHNNLKNILFFLKDTNIDLEYRDKKWGQTILMVAVMNNKHKVIEALLQGGANPNTLDFMNLTALMRHTDVSFNGRRCDIKTTKLLLQYGANLNLECNFKRTEETKEMPYALYQTTAFISACGSECLAHIKYLVYMGADINQWVGDESSCALSKELIHERMDVVRYLLIDLNARIPPFCIKGINGKDVTILETLSKIISSISKPLSLFIGIIVRLLFKILFVFFIIFTELSTKLYDKSQSL